MLEMAIDIVSFRLRGIFFDKTFVFYPATGKAGGGGRRHETEKQKNMSANTATQSNVREIGLSALLSLDSSPVDSFKIEHCLVKV